MLLCELYNILKAQLRIYDDDDHQVWTSTMVF